MKSNMGVVEWPKVCTRRESENVNLFPRSYHLTTTEKSDFTTTWPWRVWIRDYKNVEGGEGGGKRLLGRKKENLHPTHPLKLMRRNLSSRTSNNSTFFLLLWQLLQDLDDLVLQTEREELQLHWELRRLLACKTLECTVRNCSLRCQPTEYYCYQNTDVDERPVHFLSPREGGLGGFWSCHDKINPVPPKALWYSYDPPPSPPYWQLIGSQLSLVPSLYTLLATTNLPLLRSHQNPYHLPSLQSSREKGTQIKIFLEVYLNLH